MEIRMTKLAAGPDGVKHPGTVHDVSPEEGKASIDTGAADRIKKPPEPGSGQPDTTKVFPHWSARGYWTAKEASALLLGRDPYVDWSDSTPLADGRPYREHYEGLYFLIKTAMEVADLCERPSPKDVLEWAKLRKLDVPPELEQEVTARHGPVEDWKALHDQVKAELANKDEEVARLTAERDDGLNQKLSERGEELSSTERNSLFKLVIGMAIKGYIHDPNAQRSHAITEIGSDLDELGMHLDPVTIRKWLKKAAALLGKTTPADDE